MFVFLYGGQATFLKPAQVFFNTVLTRNQIWIFIIIQYYLFNWLYFSIHKHRLDRDQTPFYYAACRLNMIDNMSIKLGISFGVMVKIIPLFGHALII